MAIVRDDIYAVRRSGSSTGLHREASLGLAKRLVRAGHVLFRVAALVLMLVLIGLGIGFFQFVGALERDEQVSADTADGIVVLTGGAQRIGDAVELLVQGRAQRLLISGVNEKTNRAEIARLNPDGQRLFGCCVDLDYRARNTIGNAIETRRWAVSHNFRSLIIVTSNYHMPRTLVELASIMRDVTLVPHAVVTEQANPDRWWYEPGTARLLVSEYVKYVVALVRTKIEFDPEHSHVAVLAGGHKPVFGFPVSYSR